MLDSFRQHIDQYHSDIRSKSLLVAVSGGLDSMVLAHLLIDCRFDIAIAHCNFNLRATESDLDQQFVQQWCNEQNLDCHTTRFDTKQYAQQHQLSIQMAARELRYQYFNQLCDTINYDYILTAHHLDDQIETFLMHLNRGSGLRGLQGIPERNDRIVRPLLPFARQQIHNYAQQQSILWREDSSNATTAYQRNQLRHQVLPLLHQVLPDLRTHFNQTLDYLSDAQDMVDDALVRFRESVTTTPSGINIPISTLIQTTNPKAYLYPIICEYGFNNMHDAMQLITAQTGKHLTSSSHILLKDRDQLIIKSQQPEQKTAIVIDKTNHSYQIPKGILHIELQPTTNALSIAQNNTNPNRLFLDADVIQLPIIVRNCNTGDRIQPLGMKGSQLVSDLLINVKVPLIDKSNVVLLTSGKDILWVVGIRSSQIGKVTHTTQNLLQITYTTT